VKPTVDAAVADMRGPAALPRRNGELVFEAPWEGRAFGLALAVVRQLGLEWSEFQRHLIAAIAAHPEAPYYDCWVSALERLVLERGAVAADELAATWHAIEHASA
jgi:nitrile hydratase accessory protein